MHNSQTFHHFFMFKLTTAKLCTFREQCLRQKTKQSHIFLLFGKPVFFYLLLFKHVFSTYEKLGPKASVKNWICYQLKPDECPVSFSLTIHLNPPCKDDNSQL